MKLIANILHPVVFPLRIYDSKGNEIYYEGINGWWAKAQFNSNNNRIYYEDFQGYVKDDRE